MVIWLYSDENTNEITGWTSTESPINTTLIQIDTDDYDFDIKNTYQACVYDKESDKVIFDEEKLFKLARDSKEYDLREIAKEKVKEGFPVNINNKNLIFKPTENNRAFLEQAYSLFTNKIISETMLPFIDENGKEILERVVDSNIFEVWLLLYVNEEDIGKHLNNVVLKRLSEAKTIEEIEAVQW